MESARQWSPHCCYVCGFQAYKTTRNHQWEPLIKCMLPGQWKASHVRRGQWHKSVGCQMLPGYWYVAQSRFELGLFRYSRTHGPSANLQILNATEASADPTKNIKPNLWQRKSPTYGQYRLGKSITSVSLSLYVYIGEIYLSPLTFSTLLEPLQKYEGNPTFQANSPLIHDFLWGKKSKPPSNLGIACMCLVSVKVRNTASQDWPSENGSLRPDPWCGANVTIQNFEQEATQCQSGDMCYQYLLAQGH